MMNLNEMFLKEESLFSKFDGPLLAYLEQNDITTVEQLINIENINHLSDGELQILGKNRLEGYIELLKYKYLKVPFKIKNYFYKILHIEPATMGIVEHPEIKFRNILLDRMGFNNIEKKVLSRKSMCVFIFSQKAPTLIDLFVACYQTINFPMPLNEKLSLYIDYYYNYILKNEIVNDDEDQRRRFKSLKERIEQKIPELASTDENYVKDNGRNK